MTYRIKVIEYESGRKEYVPQVRRRWWNSWKYIDCYGTAWHIYSKRDHSCDIISSACSAINKHKEITCQSIIKFVTYKPVEP